MLDRHRLTWQGLGCALLSTVIVAYLGLSLGGYDPADPPGSASVPANARVDNPGGPVGATLAHLGFQTFGLASFALVWGLLVANLFLFTGRRVPEPAFRVAGLLMVTLVASAVIRRFAPGLRPCAPVGPGGYVGAIAVAFLEGQFGPAGMLLILTAIGVAGAALCREALVNWPIADLLGLIRRSRTKHAPDPFSQPEPTPLSTAPTRFELQGATRPAPRAAIERAAPTVGHDPAPLPMRRGDAPAPMHPAAPAGDGSFVLPPLSLLDAPVAFPIHEHEALIHNRALLLEKTLLEFGCQVRVVQIDTGPVITQFEIELEAGLRVAKINSVATDLAIALAVPNVRIVSPIPGKTTVGIEVPNDRRAMVKIGEVVAGVGDRLSRHRIPLFLGKDVKGNPLAFDLADMPHLLIAGRTGTGIVLTHGN